MEIPDATVVTHEDVAISKLIGNYSKHLLDGVSCLVLPAAAKNSDLTERFSSQVSAGTDFYVSDLRSYQRTGAGIGQRLIAGPLIAFATSGTSGNPKGVLYSANVLVSAAAAIADDLRLAQARMAVSFVPHEYAFGLSILHSHLIARRAVEFRALSKTTNVRDQLSRNEIDIVYLLPVQAAEIAAMDLAPIKRKLRFVVAGGRLSGASALRLQRLFPNGRLSHMYGQAELGPRVASWTGHLGEYKEGNVGSPLPGVRLSPRPADDGKHQVLWVASPYRMLGYLSPPEASYAISDGPFEWCTGDLASFDSSGDLFIFGRTSHYVNFAGTRLLMADIERVASTAPSVDAVKVSSRPHPELGDIPMVSLQARDHARAESETRLELEREFGRLGRAIKVEVFDELPRSDAGKL